MDRLRNWSLFLLTIPAAEAAPALDLPSLQELIAPPAPAAAPADAASGASASIPSDAEMVRSLDTVISTLDSDRQHDPLRDAEIHDPANLP